MRRECHGRVSTFSLRGVALPWRARSIALVRPSERQREPMIHWLLVLAFVPLFISTASAQPMREDIRVSPLEPYSLRLDKELRIESAAAIGVTSLVVWGTRIPTDRVGVAPAL